MRVHLAALAFALAGATTAAAPAQTERPVGDDFVSAPAAVAVPEPLAGRLAAITTAALTAHVTFLASPALAGRGLGTAGLDAAAEYAAAQLALAGVLPFGTDGPDGTPPTSYFQPVQLRALSGVAGEVLVERRDGARLSQRSFHSGVDCAAVGQLPQSVTAPVVFAGYGIRELQPARDDYRGLDVRGKVVLILDGLPPGAEWQSAALRARYAEEDPVDRWEVKLETAAAAGAAAVLALDPRSPAGGADFDPTDYAGMFLPFENSPAPLPLWLLVSPAVADTLLSAAGLEVSRAAEAAPRALPAVTATVRLTATERVLTSRNVIGVLPGSGPQRREEAIVLGAHLDHLGVVDGVVHPGADDDASGAAALLEIARALAASPARPERSLVFVLWTGEEEGKLGSGLYVRQPRWPLARTAAYLNLEMFGHPWLAEELKKLVVDTKLPDGEAFLSRFAPADFTELGLPPAVPELEAALRRAAAATGLALHFDFTDGKHGGSDYRDFARAGVPFIRFFGNFFPGYHEPGDTVAALDPAQIQRLARLALATTWELANP